MAKTTNRDEFSAPTKRLLEKQSGNHCSNPACRRVTSAASSDGKTVISIGEASHISAAAPGGPRYDETLTSDQRKAPENGIWLCKDHARAVDSKDPFFTVTLLKKWKQQANEAVWRSVIENAPFPGGPPLPSDEQVQAKLREAAAADLAIFQHTDGWPRSAVPLTLRIDQVNEHLSTQALAKAVMTFEDLILVAAPGMGKTTTVFQVADGIINAQAGAPVVILLGEWATLQDSLLGSVLKRAAYAGISESEFRRAASAPGVVLLLDGWNELDATARERARVEISRLKAELPELGLVISTRRQALDIPFAGTRVELLPLGDEQQMAIAREIRGDAGERLVDQAWRTPGVRELVAIPLYLTSLLALPNGQPFPTTKEEVLRRFVSAQEQEAGKQAALAEATGGFQASYLERLAVTMTVDANTSVTDSAARKVVNDVSRHLIDEGQIAFVAKQPDEMLNTLVSAHILVRAGDTAGLSFQHQQFQEWFASHDVEGLMLQAATDPAALERLCLDVLDNRSWTEAILFAVERTARDDQARRTACANAILAALDVDPLLAAEMIYRSSDEVWSSVSGKIQSHVERWHTPGKLDRAFRFMITTGRPEFIELLWPLLTNENDQVHLAALRAAARFRPSVLGEDAAQRLADLALPVRNHVLHEIAFNSGIDGMDLATTVAKADPDPELKVSVADALAFRRADRHLADLLSDADDSVYDLLVRKGHIDDIEDSNVQERLSAARARQKAAGVSPRERLRAMLTEEPSDSASSEVVALIVSLDMDRRNDHDRDLIWQINERHPKALAEGVLGRLRAGKELFYGADDILASAAYALEDGQLLDKALAETNPHDDIADAACSVLGPEAVGKLVDAYLDARSKLRDRAGTYDQAASDRYAALRQRLAHTQGASLVAAVLARADTAKDIELADLSELFSRRSDAEDGRGRPFDAEALAVIGSLAQKWAERLLNAEGISRHDKADIALMIGRAPAVGLLPTLQRLLDDNLVRYHDFREAAKASGWHDRASIHEAQHPHMHEYQSALISIRAPETFVLAAEYLPHEHFGENAARVLAAHWSEANEPNDDRRFIGGVDFSNVSARHAARRANPDESCPEANAIFAAVETLIAEGTTDEQHKRAVVLGSIGARLPHGQRATTIDKLIAFAPRQLRAGLLLGLVLSGEDISVDLVAQGIAETFEAAKTQAWILLESNAYQLRDWLRLLPFATPVSHIPEIVAGLPDAQRNPRMFEEMVRGLGQSPHGDSEAVLFKLAEDDPRFYQDHQWRKTVMGLGGEDMVRRLVDLILSSAMDAKSPVEWHWRNDLAGLLKEHPGARAYVHDLLKDGPANEEQALLAHTLAENPTPEDVILLVKAEIATKRAFLNGRSVESAVTVHVASEDWRGAFDVVPVPATALRSELLSLTTDGGRDDPAGRCLTEIDKIRDRYGAPETEPRHPDLASGRPWPIFTSDHDAEGGE